MTSEVLDAFEDTSSRTAVASGLVQLSIAPERAAGRQAMRLEYDFKGSGGFGVARGIPEACALQRTKRDSLLIGWFVTFMMGAVVALAARTQEILPFPPKPSGSIAGRTMQESTYSPLPGVRYLPKDTPNILFVLIDDVGSGRLCSATRL